MEVKTKVEDKFLNLVLKSLHGAVSGMLWNTKVRSHRSTKLAL